MPKRIKLTLDAYDAVDVSLMLATVKAAGLGDETFLKKIDHYINRIQKEYKKQLTSEEIKQIVKQLDKAYALERNES